MSPEPAGEWRGCRPQGCPAVVGSAHLNFKGSWGPNGFALCAIVCAALLCLLRRALVCGRCLGECVL